MTAAPRWAPAVFWANLVLVLLGFPVFAWAGVPARDYIALVLLLTGPLIFGALAWPEKARALRNRFLPWWRGPSVRIRLQALWHRVLLQLSPSLRDRMDQLKRSAEGHAQSSRNFEAQLEASLRRAAGLARQLAEAEKKLETLLPDSFRRLFTEHRDFVLEQQNLLAACVQPLLRVIDAAAQGVATGEEVFERMQHLADALGVALGEARADARNGHLASHFPEDPFEFFGTSDSAEIRSRYHKLAVFHPDKFAALEGMAWLQQFIDEFMKIINARYAEAI